MKNLYVVLAGLVIFNSILVATSALPYFNYGGELYTGEDVSTVNGVDLDNMSAMDLLSLALGGLDFSNTASAAIGAASIGIFGLAALAALFCRSPVPLAIGGLASFFTLIWGMTLNSLGQFGIPSLLLGVGTLGIGILFVINAIEIAGGGNNG